MGLAAWNFYLRIKFKTHQSYLNLLSPLLATETSYEPFDKTWKVVFILSGIVAKVFALIVITGHPDRWFHQLFGSCLKSFKLLRAQLAMQPGNADEGKLDYSSGSLTYFLRITLFYRNGFHLLNAWWGYVSAVRNLILFMEANSFFFFQHCVMPTLKPHAQPQHICRTLNKNHILYSDLC